MPLGMVGGIGFMAFVAIGEATRDSTRYGGGGVSFSCRFEAEVVTLASAGDLFLEVAPPLVFTILG